MTEQEWLASNEFHELLAIVNNERKLRLFAVACCREIWDFMTDYRSKEAVEAVELYFDGLISETKFTKAKELGQSRYMQTIRTNQQLTDFLDELRDLSDSGTTNPDVIEIFNQIAVRADWEECAANAAHISCSYPDDARYAAFIVANNSIFQKRTGKICDLLRNIVNPFHKFTFKPSKQIGNLANVIYHNKDWQALTVLADMLEEEGCTDTLLLNHLRTKEQVYKGWWSLDFVRGV